MSSAVVQLVRAAAGGDREAFGTLVSEYQQVTYAVALSIVGDFHAAQDVAQQALISAYAKLSTLREPENFGAWLRKITVNAARMWNRRQRAKGEVREAEANEVSAADEQLRNQAAPSAERGKGDDFERGLMAIVGSLPEKKRVPVLLCYMDSVSRKQAARFLGIRESTLRKRLHDAKAQLQREVVRLAERTLQEHRLPRDFARKCICGCTRKEKEVKGMQKGKPKKAKKAREAKKADCRCGCIVLTKSAG